MNAPKGKAADGDKPERIAKVMARAGLCSRRDAEKWIAAGRVMLNGEVLKTPAIVVGPADVVRVDGADLPQADKARLWRHHKPKGLVTTHKDEKGRQTVFETLPPDLPRVVSVGRLDINSEGLLLLTNDGALARMLELPSRGWVRRYRARVYGRPDARLLASVKDGVTVEGVRYGPIAATLDKEGDGKSNVWITVALSEGKNREVRKVLAHLGLTVTRLIRVAYGPFQLGNLEPGGLEEIPGQVLRSQLGTEATAGLSRKETAVTAKGRVRIIGGIWRGRSIDVEAEGLRPTSDRAREAVFNRLIHGFGEYGFRLQGAKVLDAFAGSGALGLEALSRGAAQATFLERNRGVCTLIESNIAHLGAEDRAVVLNADAVVPPRAASPFDLALLDPPYEENLLERAIAGLARQNWLRPGALVVAESEDGAAALEVEGFAVIDRRTYGRAAMTFLIFRAAEEA